MALQTAARRVPVAVVVSVLVIAGCGHDRGDSDEARVTFVVDGDTFDVRFPDGREERIRPPQVDAPEIDECGYERASVALAELILGETVELVPTSDGPDRDAHGRLLRAVRLDGEDVGAEMVRSGLARWIARYAHEDRTLAGHYEAAERQAQRASAGLWAACDW